MLGKIKLISVFIIIYLNIGRISSVCIQDGNCPFNQGVCRLDKCECINGYQTYITDQTSTNPIYCNYKQTSKWVPFLLELFFPSIGLFYLGRYFHGFLKLALFEPIIWRGKDISPFWLFLIFIVYLVDLFCLFMKYYSDGNGIALV